MKIDALLVHQLISSQFPDLANLPLRQILPGGWDNRTFRLGDQMSVRLPSHASYSFQVCQEHDWLPKLAPHLSLPIPTPLRMGKPEFNYPFSWSIYSWIEGESLDQSSLLSQTQFALDLAEFLGSLHRVSSRGGPVPGSHNFYRGALLSVYNSETREALLKLSDVVDVDALTRVWDMAVSSEWEGSPLWVHGDISVGNLLVKDGRLSAVIDFGLLAVGDPACDLVIAWNFLNPESRKVFRDRLTFHSGIDDQTWNRAKGWALWKALIVLAKSSPSSPIINETRRILNSILTDF